jgi:NodT family efflux transporter outer membrane factor (OMF) lipoprotein
MLGIPYSVTIFGAGIERYARHRWFKPRNFVMQADHQAHSDIAPNRSRVSEIASAKLRYILTPLLSAMVLAGCMVGPNYQRPTVAVPAQFKEAAPGWKVAQPNDETARGPWWEVFQDTQLNTLETQVNLANQSVAGSAAAYRQARALVAQAQAAYFPTLGVTASQTRSKSSSASFGNNSTQFGSTGGTISKQYSAGLDASWEPDLWGSVRRQVSSEKAAAQGAAATLANAQLSAQGTLAQDYFQLRSLDAEQQLLNSTVAAYQKFLDLTQSRYKEGVAARSDVITAQTQLQQAQAAALDNGIARAQYEHAIAVLVGVPASSFSIPMLPLTATPPALPQALPSALLERRPDVAVAERQAAAANEQIGIAIAAYFPSLTLSATGGFESSSFSNWLTAPARVWTVGPQLAATLFDGGLRAAQTEAARASYDQNVANYRAVVLAAFQDVEDNLASLRILEQEVVLDQAAADSADQAVTILTNQYKAGTGTYLEVITAQATAYSAHKQLVTTSGSRMVSAVGLIKALGGGWDASALNVAGNPKPDGQAAVQ